jgi:Ankyrin repeats (3 copies)
MKTPAYDYDAGFRDAILGLKRGDFSRLEPLFIERSGTADHRPQIIAWYEEGRFGNEPQALAEALTCACFNGRTSVADYLLKQGVDPTAGAGTGSDALHWAADRGQLETVRLLIQRKAPLETRNMYGGVVGYQRDKTRSPANHRRAAHRRRTCGGRGLPHRA